MFSFELSPISVIPLRITLTHYCEITDMQL